MAYGQDNLRPVDSAVDWRGNEYHAGDLVLYPRSYADSVLMQEAVVEGITAYDTTRFNHVSRQHETTVGYKVRVRPTRCSRYSNTSPSSVVTITIYENITKI